MTINTLETKRNKKAILKECLKLEHKVILNPKETLTGASQFQAVLCSTCLEEINLIKYPMGFHHILRLLRYIKRDILISTETNILGAIPRKWRALINFIMLVGLIVPVIVAGLLFLEVFYYKR